ncbi:histidine--tRNA ligase, putative [Plasmodium knowlesi strain H]|uniref:histidine--tRNA ligase n=3 Tax=Plasmodium knowlesi TaxID=5850 RepID=A0A5K1UEW8_PLAKH|nr:histidine--tRNA ligase, putative [Plasmodium knowlesi strain H]OTN65492.1 putative Histidine--tRNA ligase [Plasmodium knowlesi]CAA9989699.1 histidine--tRNA ligase, putative [Plasmodium knowlesi strain H]SBO22853.1 histidine--tRNA ligase, putative [Plasmodium knowlesi strain H]SBO23048.1 histidine--tRNA ligase, putative [Plasmodium knowlesi strain H]VVS79173.1 histidine--tRNA ligase, putative [Plasmodium knowlesi strain H]|eukprot:XP_002260422.1 histidine--tRNA ligase, putative [Plasmodium knowlesi strain H]
MSISVYKNKIFNTKDVVDVCIHQRHLKLESSSFKDSVYKLNEHKRSVDELAKGDGLFINQANVNVGGENAPKEGGQIGQGKCRSYHMDELKCLYFFFLINMLRFKNSLDLNLIRSVCCSINSTSECICGVEESCSSSIVPLPNKPSQEGFPHSEVLKQFFISNLKKCAKLEYNLNDFNMCISVVLENCSIVFLNAYKTVFLCKYLTCCLCNVLELFQINCDVLFKNAFNNNVNNSNIQSVNELISKIKWMTHDSKVEKNKELSKSLSANLLLFVYTQSKLTDDGEYFMYLINQNFKNSIDSYRSEYTDEMNSLNSYITMLCKNMNDTLAVHIRNMLDITSKVVPLFVAKMNEFLKTNEQIVQEHADLKKPLSNGFILLDDSIAEGSTSSGSILSKLYEEKYLKSIEERFHQMLYPNELQKFSEMNSIFCELLILLTDIIIQTNIMYDIKAYNKALAQVLKNKKVSGGVHHIGVGCLEFKNFLYSLMGERGDSQLGTSKPTEGESNEMIPMSARKIVINNSFPSLRRKLNVYKLDEQIEQVLIQKNINFNLKVPKGAKDFTGEDMQLRNIFFDFIKKKFLLHGAVEIDTPVFELKETLTDKYGEDSKLIFDLKEQGGENLSLRYDLTVPLYRFVNTNNLNSLKRFHIGKVYRRDEPSMNRGRFREFYQCDFDIVGKYDTLRTDFHILFIFWDILNNLKNVIGNFNCKINHRKILEYMLLSSNIHKDKVKTISSSIDKLDKITFQQFRDELLNEKGIPVESVDKIETYISKTLSLSPFLVIEFLRNDLSESPFEESYKNEVYQVINHLEELFELLKHFNMLNQFSFDLSLARGLDYYTGIIFEFVLLSETGVGSVAAGGRYDYLIRNKRKEYIPSVGASVGIERIIAIAEGVVKKGGLLLPPGEGGLLTKKEVTMEDAPLGKVASSVNVASSGLSLKENSVDVLICNIKKNCFKETIELCKKLWEEDISTEFIYVKDQKIQKQLVYALEKQIPLAVIIGDEIERGVIKLRELTQDKEKSAGEREIKLDDCVQEIKNYFSENLTWKQSITKALFGRPGL